MNNVVFGLVVVLLVGVGVGFAALVMANSPFADAEPTPVAVVTGPVQDVYIKALSTGFYDKQEVTVKKGIPVRLHFSTDGRAGCGSVLFMEKFGVRLAPLNGQEAVAVFTPAEAGRFAYRCSMNMFRGTMVVE